MTGNGREEFEEFVHARYDRLCRTAFLLCGDWQHAEDIVQTALAKSYVAFRRGHVESLDAYVHRAVVTTRASWWRRRWQGEVATGALPDRAAATDDYAEADQRSAVRAALAALPAKQREVLVLRFFADVSEADTANALGISAGTVKSRVSRALATLRANGLLAEQPDPDETPAGHHV
ncbi:MAG TPA: SigE family RNA polymerase sigma factor [Mycobacteriales bacterium]|jgi:RNA polymerase sigma-70 factor (sigma-E family)|nr:SigE family RNA polymerase sigma factor [Mycobacteriales bacterium]